MITGKYVAASTKGHSENYFEICTFCKPAGKDQVAKKSNPGLWSDCGLLCFAVSMEAAPPHLLL